MPREVGTLRNGDTLSHIPEITFKEKISGITQVLKKYEQV